MGQKEAIFAKEWELAREGAPTHFLSVNHLIDRLKADFAYSGCPNGRDARALLNVHLELQKCVYGDVVDESPEL
jgi:hypothetical protein